MGYAFIRRHTPLECSHSFTFTHSWSNNCSTCTGTATCTKCGHSYSEDGTISVNNSSAATCLNKAKWDYKATFDSISTDTCPDYHYGTNLDPNNHEGQEVYGGTLAQHKKWSCCGKTIQDGSYHNWEYINGVCGGTAELFNCVCGASKVQHYSMYGELVSISGSCPGTVTYTYKCSYCGEQFTESTYYSAHQYDMDPRPTYNGDGTHTATCIHCRTQITENCNWTNGTCAAGDCEWQCDVCLTKTAHSHSPGSRHTPCQVTLPQPGGGRACGLTFS